MDEGMVVDYFFVSVSTLVIARKSVILLTFEEIDVLKEVFFSFFIEQSQASVPSGIRKEYIPNLGLSVYMLFLSHS
jgi:hypothetical protein